MGLFGLNGLFGLLGRFGLFFNNRLDMGGEMTDTVHMDTNKTAEQLRAEASRMAQEAADSFARCDTDGFLSQWAMDLGARERRAQAAIVEAGGVCEFPALT